MAMIELELDEPTLQRARQLAESRHGSLEDLVKEALERMQPEAFKEGNNPIIGMFSDIPDVLDEIVADAMEARERRLTRSE
jgi:hypothetical protein